MYGEPPQDPDGIGIGIWTAVGGCCGGGIGGAANDELGTPASACVTRAICSGVREANSAAKAVWSIGRVAATPAKGLRSGATDAGKTTGGVGAGGVVGTGRGAEMGVGAGGGGNAWGGGEVSFPLFNTHIPSR